MPDTAYSLRSSLLASLTGFKRPVVPLRVALRNTVAVVLALVVGIITGHMRVGLGIAVGAFIVMNSDQPGAYAQRLRLIATVTVAGAISAWVGFSISPYPWLTVPVLGIWGFTCGMLVLFGPRMTRVGVTSLVLLTVATAIPLPPLTALAASGLILIGGALQALFSIAAWPLRRYRPERFALATMYRGLARQMRRDQDGDSAPPVTDTLTTLQQTLLGRPLTGSRAMEAFRTLLDLAERMRLELVALDGKTDEHGDVKAHLKAAATTLDAIAEALHDAAEPTHARHLLLQLQELDGKLDGSRLQDPATAARLHALTGQIAAAVRNANWAGSQGEIRAAHVDARLPTALRTTSPWSTLRANLRTSSSACRHSIRLAVVLVIAGVLANWTPVGHSYWLPMTAAIALRPGFGDTLNFIILRMLGTVAGLILTTVILALMPNAILAHVALFAILCFTFRYLATAHYGVAVAALTGAVVILLGFEGMGAGQAATERVLQTISGCILAYAAYRIWPTWERWRTYPALATMLDRYADYLAELTRPTDAQRRIETRSAARMARGNAGSSILRLQSEPATRQIQRELAASIFAASNRLIRTCMALEAVQQAAEAAPSFDPATTAFLACAADKLRTLARSLHTLQPATSTRPTLRDRQRELTRHLHATADTAMVAQMATLTDRLTDNIDTLGHALERLPEAHPRSRC